MSGLNTQVSLVVATLKRRALLVQPPHTVASMCCVIPPGRFLISLSFLPCGGCPHLLLCPDPLIPPALSCFPCRLPVPPALQKVDLICFDVKVLRRSRPLTWLPVRECPPWSGRLVSEHTPLIHLARSALWVGDRPEWNRFSSSFCLIRVVGAQLKSTGEGEDRLLYSMWFTEWAEKQYKLAFHWLWVSSFSNCFSVRI